MYVVYEAHEFYVATEEDLIAFRAVADLIFR
jgi:hypothetical protein